MLKIPNYITERFCSRDACLPWVSVPWVWLTAQKPTVHMPWCTVNSYFMNFSYGTSLDSCFILELVWFLPSRGQTLKMLTQISETKLEITTRPWPCLHCVSSKDWFISWILFLPNNNEIAYLKMGTKTSMNLCTIHFWNTIKRAPPL